MDLVAYSASLVSFRRLDAIPEHDATWRRPSKLVSPVGDNGARFEGARFFYPARRLKAHQSPMSWALVSISSKADNNYNRINCSAGSALSLNLRRG